MSFLFRRAVFLFSFTFNLLNMENIVVMQKERERERAKQYHISRYRPDEIQILMVYKFQSRIYFIIIFLFLIRFYSYFWINFCSMYYC